MQEAPDPRRHPRTVMATDTEWQRIRERAEAAGMPISRLICQRAAGPDRRPPGVAPEAVLARLERIETAVLVLAEIERQRLAERGEEEGWEAATRRVALRLRAERPVAGDAARHDPRPPPQHLLQPGRVCQTAFNIDPRSACKIDPPERHGGGCPGSQ